MDALPIQDRKDAAYCSRVKGRMHAQAMTPYRNAAGGGDGAGRVEDSFNGNVKFIFQPRRGVHMVGRHG